MEIREVERRPAKFPLVSRGTGDTDTFVAGIRRLSRAGSLQEVMATATQAARSLLGADGITFVLREEDRCHYADEDAISPLWKGKRFPIDACISGWCMMQGRTATIRNVYDDNRIPHGAYEPTFVKSLAMVPVRKEDPIAAMGAYWANEREVTSEELDLLQTIADAAALAIANVQLQKDAESLDLAGRENVHRMKNLFAVALALIRQTDGETTAEYRDALTGRLKALELAHAAIFEAEQAADLCDLLHRLLTAYGESHRFELQCETTDLSLSAAEASNLALVINELGTNAAKYGALSGSTGRVTVSCKATEEGLRLTWQETGGPPVTPPSQTGFGTTVIRAIAVCHLRGSVDLMYPPEGFRCEMLLVIGKR